MSDDSDESDSIDLHEGDVSMVIRANGNVDFIVAVEDESGEEYLRCISLVRYLKFALEDERCKKLFEMSSRSTLN